MKAIKISLLIVITLIAVEAKAQVKVLSDGSMRGNINGALRINTGNGTIDMGPQNYWCAHIQTDLDKFYFNKNVCLGTGTLYSYRDNPLYLGTYNGSWHMVTITAGNKVGIGTTNPQYTLDVYGDIATYGVLRISSDEKIKENIIPLTNCLSKLNKVNGKSYFKRAPNFNIQSKQNFGAGVSADSIRNLTDTLPKQPEFGVIAQELKSVFPELVDEDGQGMLTVNYIGLIPVIIEALKEQKSVIDAQSLKIKELENRLSILENNSGKGSVKSAQVTTNNEDVINSATNAFLYQNVPNPFTQNTEIRYFLPENIQSASLYIFNMQGTQIKNIPINNRGAVSATINGSELTAGMYLYTLIADGKEIDTKRMILTQ